MIMRKKELREEYASKVNDGIIPPITNYAAWLEDRIAHLYSAGEEHLKPFLYKLFLHAFKSEDHRFDEIYAEENADDVLEKLPRPTATEREIAKTIHEQLRHRGFMVSTMDCDEMTKIITNKYGTE